MLNTLLTKNHIYSILLFSWYYCLVYHVIGKTKRMRVKKLHTENRKKKKKKIAKRERNSGKYTHDESGAINMQFSIQLKLSIYTICFLFIFL